MPGVASASPRPASARPTARTWWCSRSTRAQRSPACSRRTASAPRRCSCAASIWPAGAGIRALLINTGNANAGTGADGLARARRTCAALAALHGHRAEQVLPFSTGVIMEPLPVERIEAGAAGGAGRRSSPTTGPRPPRRIMTTDTVPKAASRQVQIGGRTVTVTGIAKGAGMIRPNMATMLGFVATDAAIAPALLQRAGARGRRRVASTASPSTATPRPTTPSC